MRNLLKPLASLFLILCALIGSASEPLIGKYEGRAYLDRRAPANATSSAVEKEMLASMRFYLNLAGDNTYAVTMFMKVNGTEIKKIYACPYTQHGDDLVMQIDKVNGKAVPVSPDGPPATMKCKVAAAGRILRSAEQGARVIVQFTRIDPNK